MLDGGEDGDRLYVVTPLLQAPTLERVLDAGPLAPDEALLLLAPIADALDAAHVAGLVHRGLTPGAILVPRAGYAMLTGFGLVGMRQRPARVLEYLPPEEIETSPSTDAGDRYAFAAILHESLTGIRPSVPGSPAELGRGGRRKPEPVAPALGAVLADALAMEPFRRPATARQLMDACGYALSHPAPVVGPVRRVGRALGTGARRTGRWVAVAVVVAWLAAVAGMLTAGKSSPAPTPAPPGFQTVAAQGLELSVPDRWTVHAGASAAVPGLRASDATIAAPPEMRGVASMVVGHATVDGPLVGASGLPSTLRGPSGEGDAPEVVRLGDGNAYRVAGLRGPVAGRQAVVYVVPTVTGAAYVGCVAQAGYVERFIAQCERAVGTARVTDKARSVSVSDAERHDAALAAALSGLKRDRKVPFALLVGARSRATQANGASGVAAAYRRAARAVEAIGPSALFKARDAAILSPLNKAAAWWAVAARAARRGDRARYLRARTATAHAQQQLGRATRG